METWFIPTVPSPLPPALNVLVLAPHPDDEVFGCGGCVALYALAGTTVHPHILTDGGGYSTGAERHAVVALRREESHRAAQILGTAAPTFGPWQDRQLSAADELVGHLDALIQATAADFVFAPSLWEIHPDHRATAWAAIRAVSARYQAQGSAPFLAFYEVGAPLWPTHLISISAVLDIKREAMAAFASQLVHQRYDEHINALNTYRTYTLAAGVAAAEALVVVPASQLDKWTSAYTPDGPPGLAQVTETALQKATVSTEAMTAAAQAMEQILRSLTQRLDKEAKEATKTVIELQQARDELQQARDELQVFKQQMAALLMSCSWRITRPLRWLSEKLRG